MYYIILWLNHCFWGIFLITIVYFKLNILSMIKTLKTLKIKHHVKMYATHKFCGIIIGLIF